MIEGAFTAIVTPFRDGEVDWDQLDANVKYQIEAGIDGIVPVGTTGESPTLSHEEHEKVIEKTIDAVRNYGGEGVKVIAGTGSNSTREALSLTKHAEHAGADAALMVNPYYNKPTQEGLYRHFMEVADAIDLPIVLYNIPGRTGITMSPDTVARLARHPNIVADKEATGSMDIASEIMSKCDIDILSGDDSLTLPLMSMGAKGVISVVANLLPAPVKQLVDAAAQGDFARAREIHYQLFPLFKGCLMLSTNPIPIKAALKLVGRDTGELRLPMTELEGDDLQKLATMLQTQGLM